MLLTRVLSLSAVLVALACASNSEILVLDPSLRPQTSPQSIRLIAQEPTRPYLVVAIVSTRGAVDEARHRLIKEAARLGGHAVLFDSSSLTRIGGDETQQPQLTGKIIVYTDSTGSK
jgi:hypothetical protein